MRKNFLSVFIIVAGLEGSLFAQDSKLFVTRVEVQGAAKSLVITDYTGAEKAVVIPANIDGLPVRKIGDRAFRLKGLTEVSIPNGIEIIGNQAFFGNQLELVIIPLSVKVISDSAFDSNMLQKVISGSTPAVSYTSNTISSASFSTKGSVKPQFKTYFISADKLRYAGQITGVDVVLNYGDFYNPLTGFDGNYKPVRGSRKDTGAKEESPPSALTLGKNAMPPPGDYAAYSEKPVTYIIKLKADGGIGRCAYMGRGFDIIVIPEGTTYIGEAAFYSNNLTTIRIPDSVRFIGNQAFMGNNLSSITIGENVTVQYDSFRYQFLDYYRMNKFKAGTYILKAGQWNYEGNERKPKSIGGM